MKRDDELVRKIILEVEAKGHSVNSWIENFSIPDYSEEAVSYHLGLLWRAGLIEVSDCSCDGHDEYISKCLTPVGHDFANSVRDPDAWRFTKDAVAKAGSVSLEVVAQVAKAFVVNKLSRTTGFFAS